MNDVLKRYKIELEIVQIIKVEKKRNVEVDERLFSLTHSHSRTLYDLFLFAFGLLFLLNSY